MKSRCTICTHPFIDDMNLAILSGNYSLDELSQKFGPSRSAFHRHGRHLEKKINQALKRLENHRQQVAFFKLSDFLDHVQRWVEAAAADGDTDRVFKGSHIGSRIIHQINKMDVPLELDTAYRLLFAPDPASRDSLLPAGPGTIAGLHQALVDKTLAPCPPPAVEEPDDTADQMAELPDPENDLLQLLAALESKSRRRQTAKDNRKNQQLLRKKLRRQKHFLNGKKLPKNPLVEIENFPSGAHDADAGFESAAAAPAASPLLETRNSKPETPLPEPETPTDPRSLTPDHCPSAPDPELGRDKSATEAKRQRRKLRKMLRYQRNIFKAKKLLQKFTASRNGDATPATMENLESLSAQEHSSTHTNEERLPSPVSPGTRNPEPETPTDPWALTTEHRLAESPPDHPETPDPSLETRNPKLKPPPPCDETARRADELFEISHGYKRNNPPNKIPNRRRDEDFRSGRIFGNVQVY